LLQHGNLGGGDLRADAGDELVVLGAVQSVPAPRSPDILMKARAEKELGYAAAVILAVIVLSLVIGLVEGRL
jgi:hypothetical protein